MIRGLYVSADGMLAQRAYEVNSKSIQSADQMLAIVNSLLR